MPDNRLIEYESLDMGSATVLSPRSRLYCLEPVGLRTPFVECLTSYFTRLAEAHSVSVGVLHHHEMVPLKVGQKNMFGFSVKARTRCFTSCINSAGRVASNFVRELEKLTGREELRYLTMLPWKSLLPLHFLTRGVAGWCPRCLTHWRDRGQTVYIPLLWALDVVTCCPQHRLLLHLACSHCGLPQQLLGQRTSMGHCTKCKRWLGTDRGKGNKNGHPQRQPSEWELWISDQMKALIETAFRSPSLLSPKHLSRLIQAATDSEGVSPVARLLGVSSTAVTEWRNGLTRPLLPAYLRLARVLYVTLPDLLTGNVTLRSARSLDFDSVPYWRNLSVRRRITFDPTKARREMETALQEVPPPSLASFRRRTRYHQATLLRNLPDLYHALRERFRKHQAICIENRQQAKIAEFRKAAKELHHEGIKLYVHRVLKRMPPPRGLDYRIACKEFAQISREDRCRLRIPFRQGPSCRCEILSHFSLKPGK